MMIPKILIRFVSLFLVPALIADPSLAAALRNSSSRDLSWHTSFRSVMVEQALEARGLPYFISEASPKSEVFFEEAGISRRDVSWTLAVAGFVGRLAGAFSVTAAGVYAQSVAFRANLVAHLNGASRWIYSAINPDTYLNYSHPGDVRIARWSVSYDNTMRIMDHIQTDDLAMAVRTMDYFIDTKAIRKNGGWIVNVIDATSKEGLMLDDRADTGVNAYLGLAAAHLYEVTKNVKYLNFARERWTLIKAVQNEKQGDPNYGAVHMGPEGDPQHPGDQHMDHNPQYPSWYQLYNAEHAADFKALSDLLYILDASATDRQKYRRASDLIAIWDKTIFNEETNLFYWGTTEVPFFDDDFGFERQPGIVKAHPLDATALKMIAYGPEGLEQLLGSDKAELIRKAADVAFKVTVTFQSPTGTPVTATGYDFVSAEERRRMVIRRPNVQPTVGRQALLWDEGSTLLAFADRRYQDYYDSHGDKPRADAYRASYEENALNQGLKTAIQTPAGLARPYAQPIPTSYRTQVGWGWTTPHAGYSLIGNVARNLGILSSDPYLPKFGRYAEKVAIEKNMPLSNRLTSTSASAGEIIANVRQVADAGWSLLNENKFSEAAAIADKMIQEHPDWLAEAKRVEERAAAQPLPTPKPDRSNLGEIFSQYGSLYYIGAVEWIRFLSYNHLGNHAKALQSAIAILRDYPHTQVYDNRNFFWQPALALRREYAAYYNEAMAALGRKAAIPGSRRDFFAGLRSDPSWRGTPHAAPTHAIYDPGMRNPKTLAAFIALFLANTRMEMGVELPSREPLVRRTESATKNVVVLTRTAPLLTPTNDSPGVSLGTRILRVFRFLVSPRFLLPALILSGMFQLSGAQISISKTVYYLVQQLPPQTVTVLVLVTVLTGMAIFIGIRHLLGRGTTDASHITGSRLSRAIHHFVALPGSFYAAIFGATALSEVLNFQIYLNAPPSNDPHMFFAKQMLLLTIGVIFVLRILHLILSSVWMIMVRAPAPPAPLALDDKDLPVVTVQIAIRNEPYDVVKATLDSVLAIRYPKDRLEIQIIDNSSTEAQYSEIRDYALSHGAVFLHRDGTEGFKAGNLNLGRKTARGRYFLILDSDSAVEPDVFLKSLPEFRNDPNLGFVQLRIITSNESTNGITKIVAMGMRGYHRLYESLMNKQGFVKFDGHNGIISAESIDAIGGWQYEVSEDLATSLKIRMAGFGSKYVSYVETWEESPTSWQELMKQQRKWSFGTTKILVQQFFTIVRAKNLKWFEKADIIFQMMGYFTTALGFILIFAFIQFPTMGAIIILVAPYIPVIIANYKDHRRDVFGRFALTTLVFSGLLPTLFTGVSLFFLGVKEGFRVTTKGKAQRLSLGKILRLNALGFAAAVIYFYFVPTVFPDIPAFLQQIPPSVIAMGSALIAPFALNYIPSMGGDASPSEIRIEFRIRRLLRRGLLSVALLTFFALPTGEHSFTFLPGWIEQAGFWGLVLSAVIVVSPWISRLLKAAPRDRPRVQSPPSRWAVALLAASSFLSMAGIFNQATPIEPAPRPLYSYQVGGSEVAVVHNEQGNWLRVNGRLESGVPGFDYQPTPPGKNITDFEHGRLRFLYKALLPSNGGGIDPDLYPDLIELAKSSEGAPAVNDGQLLEDKKAQFFATYPLDKTTSEDRRMVVRIFNWVYAVHHVGFDAGMFAPSMDEALAVVHDVSGSPALRKYRGWNEFNMWVNNPLSYADIDRVAGAMRRADSRHPVGIIISQRLRLQDIFGIRNLRHVQIVELTIYTPLGIAASPYLARTLGHLFSPKAIAIAEIGIPVGGDPQQRASDLKAAAETLVMTKPGEASPVLSIAWFALKGEEWKKQDNAWWFEGTPALDAVASVHQLWVPGPTVRPVQVGPQTPMLQAPKPIDLTKAHYDETKDFRLQTKAVFWDLAAPLKVHKGQKVRIQYTLKNSDVMGVQLKPIGETEGEKGAMVVVKNASSQDFVEITMTSDVTLWRIAFQLGPNAWEYLGGSMDAKIFVETIDVIDPALAMIESGKPSILANEKIIEGTSAPVVEKATAKNYWQRFGEWIPQPMAVKLAALGLLPLAAGAADGSVPWVTPLISILFGAMALSAFIAPMSRRTFGIKSAVATLTAWFTSAVPLLSQPIQIEQRILAHLNEVWRWVYAQIDSRTYQASSHPGDPSLTRWSVVYDAAMRTMGHLQTGRIDLAKKTMDFFMTESSIRQPNGWIMNIIDAGNGAVKEYVAHTGSNAYLGLAAFHLYEATKEVKYLEFAKDRWALIEKIQNKDPKDFNYGAVPMSPKPGSDFTIDPKYQWNPDGPSFYQLYNGEHNADFKALSNLLFDLTKDQKYKRASDLVSVWDRKIFDPKTKTFFWGTTTKAYHDQDFDVNVPVGIVPWHPLDASALRLSLYGVDGLNDLLRGRGVSAEDFRAAIDAQFKVSVTFTNPTGQKISVDGYDFINASERKQLALYSGPISDRNRRRIGQGREPMLTDEWSTWVAFGDLRFASDFHQKQQQAKADRYQESYRQNAIEQALKTGVQTPNGIARPYAHPIPYSWDKPVGWGWNTPVRPAFSIIGDIARSLGMLASDPFLVGFGPYARKIALNVASRLAIYSHPNQNPVLVASLLDVSA